MADNYIFTSERLGFRTWKESDKLPFFHMNSDPEVMKYFPSALTRPESDDSISSFQRHMDKYRYSFYAVDLLIQNKFIGFIGIKNIPFEASFTPAVEIGWRLDKRVWNLGLATEGAKRCLRHAFEDLNIDEIYSITPHLNQPSERVMKKIGMKKSGEFIHPKLSANHTLQPMMLYCIKRAK